MFTKKNKARWLTIMAVRRAIRIETPDAPYLKTMPPTFQFVILKQFQEMQQSSTAGTYDQNLRKINIIDSSRSTRRHEVQHALNHYASMYPACAIHLPISVCIAASFMRCRSLHAQAIGLILNETISHWVDGDKKFLFNANQYYIKKVSTLSNPVARIWRSLTPMISIVFLYGLLYFLIQIVILYVRIKTQQ